MTSLAGRIIVTTRDRRGRLDVALEAFGAEVLHLPLIEIVDAADQRPLVRALRDIAAFDWVVVTSQHGANRVVEALAEATTQPRLAAVGTRTAEVLGRALGRRVELVPARQTAADLVEVFKAGGDAGGAAVLVAQADRAEPTLAAGLDVLGYRVTAVTAYETHLRRPPPSDIERALRADAVAFASGSSVESWAVAIGTSTPKITVAIGPTTAAAAERTGIDITHTATEHSIDGLIAAIVAACSA